MNLKSLLPRLFDAAPLVALVALCCGCKGKAPEVAGVTVTGVTATEATFGSAVTDHGDEIADAVGFIFCKKSTNPDPYITGFDELPDGVEMEESYLDSGDVFTADASGLEPGEEYVVRAYANNSKGGLNFSTDTTTFTTPPGSSAGEGIGSEGSYVQAVAVQADGKVLIGGEFTEIRGERRFNIARLNPDGSLDDNFAPIVDQPHYGGFVNAIAVQTDGYILIGGYFDHIDGQHSTVSLARLLPDGSVDSHFQGTTEYARVDAILVQPDGKILVAGDLVALNGNTTYKHIGRLNADGSLDTTFNIGTGPSTTVNNLAVQSDGKILIGGYFSTYNGVNRPGFARLNANGSLDTGFDPDAFLSYTFALQPDGKILLCGDQVSVSGPRALFRLNTDGTVDSSYTPSVFDHPNGPFSVVFNSISIQADGKAIIVGEFDDIDGNPVEGIVRVDANGTYDPSFDANWPNLALGGFPPIFPISSAASDKGIFVGGLDIRTSATDKEIFGFYEKAPANSSLGNIGTSSVLWVRGGTAPELYGVTFELSVNGGSTWTALPAPTRFGGTSWKTTGLSLPASGLLRARGLTRGGRYGGSGGVIEAVDTFPTSGGAKITLANPTSTDVTAESATLGGEITNGGSLTIFYRGVVVSRTVDSDLPFTDTAGAYVELDPGNGTGVFTVPVDLLEEGTSYTFRAFAQNYVGTFYSEPGEFTTGGAPAVITPTVFDVMDTSATLGAFVISVGGNEITERGVIVAPATARIQDRLVTKATSAIPPFVSPGTTGPFMVNATGLAEGTDYYFVGYAVSELGTTYSPKGFFTTTGMAPAPMFSGTESEPGAFPAFSNDETGGGGFAGLAAGAIEPFDAGPINGNVQAIALSPGGKTIVGGEFSLINGQLAGGIARFDDQGRDPGFAASTNGVVNGLAILPDGRMLIVGAFNLVNGTSRNGVAMVEENGSLVDASEFSVGAGADNVVYAVALQQDGKILLGGAFRSYRGQACGGVIRLEEDGRIDTTFDPGDGADDSVFSVTAQPDGKILVAGNFDTFDGTTVGRIVRLNGTGALDTTFGTGANGRIAGVTVLDGNAILAYGDFSAFDGTPSPRVVRITSAGAVDGAFAAALGQGAGGPVYSAALQTDGKIILAGDFSLFDGSAVGGVMRLGANGTPDPGFNVGTGADDEVDAVALAADGSLIIGGAFEQFDGQTRSKLVRYGNDVGSSALTVAGSSAITWNLTGTSPEVDLLGFEVTTDGGVTWTDLGVGVPTATGWNISGLDLPITATVRAIGRTAGGFLGGSSGILEAAAGYDYAPTIASLRAQIAASTKKELTLKNQIKAAKKKKKNALVKSLTKKLKKQQTATRAISADLAQYL